MPGRGRPRYPDILTPRQFEVLELVREGLTNPQIAERLGISPDGAKWHVKEIIWKLGVRSREEAARWIPEREEAPTARLDAARSLAIKAPPGRPRRLGAHRRHQAIRSGSCGWRTTSYGRSSCRSATHREVLRSEKVAS